MKKRDFRMAGSPFFLYLTPILTFKRIQPFHWHSEKVFVRKRAIKKAIKECIDKGILVEYLKRKGSEVENTRKLFSI